MEIDVVIPSLRAGAVSNVLFSLSQNTVKPDLVTIVSNEISSGIAALGLNVRILHFESRHYPFGHKDVALRRNIGIWHSPCSHVVTFDDDQIAPENLIETSRSALDRREHFWGHYRYLDFTQYSLASILRLPPSRGRPRETPSSGWHLYFSAYAGLLGAEKQWLQSLGGFDLIFCGRHAGEDQNLGRRMSRRLGHGGRILVSEPPFAWHPEARLPWSPAALTNLCKESHQLRQETANGLALLRCRLCPYFETSANLGSLNDVVIPFEPAKVEVSVEAPRSSPLTNPPCPV